MGMAQERKIWPPAAKKEKLMLIET